MSPRHAHFPATRRSFPDHPDLSLHRVQGPLSFLNPTRAHYSSHSSRSIHSSDTSAESQHIGFLWRSRDNRKGRHLLLIKKHNSGDKETPLHTLVPSYHPSQVLQVVIKTFTTFPYWDISWLVAFIFTLGSVVWVINGFFSWLPLVAPSTEFNGETYYGGGITAFIGAVLFFEIGSILLVLEAINDNTSVCFGWAIEQLLQKTTANVNDTEHDGLQTIKSHGLCHHHHQNRRNLVGRAQDVQAAAAVEANIGDTRNPTLRQWQWYPSWHDLRTHYCRELGFLAGASQLFGATVFGVAGFTPLPGIMNHLTPQWRLNAAFWIPQVIGGSGFIASGLLYMLETQEKWWKPAPHLLGWQIAFWNLIGALGFTLCGALGIAHGNSGAQYQASLATFWGSWAFLIGSYLQLCESLNKYPVRTTSHVETESIYKDKTKHK